MTVFPMKDKELNMPELPKNVFLALMTDKSWSWRGLAELIYEINPVDAEELASIIVQLGSGR